GTEMSIIDIEHGYIFVIPISDTRISVGVVVGERTAGAYGADFKALFETELRRSSLAQKVIAGAPPGLPVSPTLNASYVCRPASGPGYVLAGEAAAFLDPFNANGIGFALRTGALAADTVDWALATGDDGRRGELQRRYDAPLYELLETY